MVNCDKCGTMIEGTSLRSFHKKPAIPLNNLFAGQVEVVISQDDSPSPIIEQLDLCKSCLPELVKAVMLTVTSFQSSRKYVGESGSGSV